MIKLTPREQQVLRTIRQYKIDSGNFAPSLQEIADLEKISKARAAQLVAAIEKKGWITRLKNTARSIALVR